MVNSKVTSQAFTLIELIIVIVLLGILAATALPRFVDFSSDAEAAKLEALGGGMSAAVNIYHMRWRASDLLTGRLLMLQVMAVLQKHPLRLSVVALQQAPPSILVTYSKLLLQIALNLIVTSYMTMVLAVLRQ